VTVGESILRYRGAEWSFAPAALASAAICSAIRLASARYESVSANGRPMPIGPASTTCSSALSRVVVARGFGSALAGGHRLRDD